MDNNYGFSSDVFGQLLMPLPPSPLPQPPPTPPPSFQLQQPQPQENYYYPNYDYNSNSCTEQSMPQQSFELVGNNNYSSSQTPNFPNDTNLEGGYNSYNPQQEHKEVEQSRFNNVNYVPSYNAYAEMSGISTFDYNSTHQVIRDPPAYPGSSTSYQTLSSVACNNYFDKNNDSSGDGMLHIAEYDNNEESNRVQTSESHVSNHLCGQMCVDAHAGQDGAMIDILKYFLRTVAPLEVPSSLGWNRSVEKKTLDGLPYTTVTYKTPCAQELISLEQVYAYLCKTNFVLPIDFFCFDVLVKCKRIINKLTDSLDRRSPDISNGQEIVPIPFIVDNKEKVQLTEVGTYTKDRIFGKTASELFLQSHQPNELITSCCDCTDDCQNNSKCKCWLQTAIIANSLKVGYEYRRLYNPVPSGIYECNDKCSCRKTHCFNRVAQNSMIWMLQVHPTAKTGLGVRSVYDIPKGSFVCLIAGRVLTEEEATELGGNDNRYRLSLKVDQRSESDIGVENLSFTVIGGILRSRKGRKRSKSQSYRAEAYANNISLNTSSDRLSLQCNFEPSQYHNTILDHDHGYAIASPSRIMSLPSVSSERQDDDILRSALLNQPCSSRKGGDGADGKILPQSFAQMIHQGSSVQLPSFNSLRLPGRTDIFGRTSLPCVSQTAINCDLGPMKRRSQPPPPEVQISQPQVNILENGTPTEVNSFSSVAFDTNSVNNSHGVVVDNFILDALHEGNVGKYLNHSCDPTAFIQPVYINNQDTRVPNIAVFARKHIRFGMELTVDYEAGKYCMNDFICLCRSKKCRERRKSSI